MAQPWAEWHRLRKLRATLAGTRGRHLAITVVLHGRGALSLDRATRLQPQQPLECVLSALARRSKNSGNLVLTERTDFRRADSVRPMGMVHEGALSMDKETTRRTGGVVHPVGVFAVAEFYFLLGRVYGVLVFGPLRNLFN